MKVKIIRDYPSRAVDDGMIDMEHSLFEGTKSKRITASHIGFFMQLKVYDGEIVDIYKLSTDSKRITNKNLKETEEIGLIRLVDNSEGEDYSRTIYLNNPDDVFL